MKSESRTVRQSPDRSNAANKMLSVENLSVAYSGGSISALEGVSLDVFEGEIVALLGVNGAGKTTLLRAISGLLGIHGGTIAGGTIRYQDNEVSGESAWSRVRKGISISLEGRRVFTDLSVRDNLKAGGYIQSKSAAAKAYENVVELFPVLARKKDLPAGLLSGGEQQMLAVGRALMQGPKLLLLDEPSLGLAPLIVKQIRDIIVEINGRGCSVLLIEQNVATAMSIADYAYVLDSRRVQHQGTAASLLEDNTLRDLYLGIAAPAAGHEIENGAPY